MDKVLKRSVCPPGEKLNTRTHESPNGGESTKVGDVSTLMVATHTEISCEVGSSFGNLKLVVRFRPGDNTVGPHAFHC